MVNAKELRTAADVTHAYLAHDKDDLNNIAGYIEMLTEHILATVRDDDDDPISREWLSKLFSRDVGDRFEFGCGLLIEFAFFPSSELWLHDNLMVQNLTRGQFRKLCYGLGIVLKLNSDPTAESAE